MDRNEIERRINILKQYYDPTKANYQRLDDLITRHASYYEIATTLEEIETISNTPENVISFIEVLKQECKNLHNLEIQNKYQNQIKKEPPKEEPKVIEKPTNTQLEETKEEEQPSLTSEKKMTYLNLNTEALVQYIKEAKVISKPEMTFNITITTTNGKDRKVNLFFKSTQTKPNIPGVEIVYNDTQTFDNKILRDIVGTYIMDNKPTKEEVEEEKGNYFIANEKTSLKLQDMNIEAITNAQLYVEITTTKISKPSGPIHIRKNNKEAAKGNIFVILIILALIIVISLVCTIFYKLSA